MLRRIILLHLGLVTFRFAYRINRKPIICMISGFSDVSMSPNTNICYLLRPQNTSTKPRKARLVFEKYYVYESRNVGNPETSEKLERRTPKIMKIRLNIS